MLPVLLVSFVVKHAYKQKIFFNRRLTSFLAETIDDLPTVGLKTSLYACRWTKVLFIWQVENASNIRWFDALHRYTRRWQNWSIHAAGILIGHLTPAVFLGLSERIAF